MTDHHDSDDRPTFTFQPGETHAGIQPAIVKTCETVIEDAMQNRVERLLVITMSPDGGLGFRMSGACRWPIDAVGMLETMLDGIKRKLS